MTPQQYLELVRERWQIVVAGLLLGVAVAAGVVLLSPTLYPSTVTMVVSGRSSPDVATAFEGDQLSTQRMQTYVQLATSTRVATEVAAELRLNVTGEELAERVTAAAEPETILLRVTVTDPDPQRAALIANTLAAKFSQDVAQVEQPADLAVAPLVTVKVYEPATVSFRPESPRPALILALGTVLGLIVGLGAAVAVQALDTSVKSRRRLAEVVRAPVLGVLSAPRRVIPGSLLVRDQPRGPQAEEFRRLRTNLQHAGLDRGCRIIMVTSPSEGDGKTTVVCNLAYTMADAGRRVLLIDADMRRPRAAVQFGGDTEVGLTDVLSGRAKLSTVVRHWAPGIDGIAVGPMPTSPGEILGSPRMRDLLADARSRYDVVLVDSPATLPVADAAIIAPVAEGVLLAVRRGASLSSVEETTEALAVVSGRLLGTVLTVGSGRRGTGEAAPNSAPADNAVESDQMRDDTDGSGAPVKGSPVVPSSRKPVDRPLQEGAVPRPDSATAVPPNGAPRPFAHPAPGTAAKATVPERGADKEGASDSSTGS